MKTDRDKFKKEMTVSQYFMNKNAKSMFDVIDMCEYYKNAARQTNRSDECSFVNLLNQEMEELKNSMSEKENQIKEITSFLQVYSNIDQSYYDGEWQLTNVYSGLAKTLYNKDLRIVPKDSVVLSKDDYEAMQIKIEQLTKYAENERQLREYYCKEASKEKAENIFKELIKRAENISFFDCRTGLNLDELAKQSGVEIKE